MQILIIKRCIQVYKFIDYFHDKRKDVPLKYSNQQPPIYILNALFVKMKADYLRYIYECLSGDNGLLQYNMNDKINVKADVDMRETHGVKNTDDVDVCYSEIYYSLYPTDGKKNTFKNAKEQLDNFYKKDMTLLEYLEHEVVFEYEKVKDQLFDDERKPKKYPKKENPDDFEYAKFHQVFLSSLLNQTVFLGDVQEQKYRESIQKASDIAQTLVKKKTMK